MTTLLIDAICGAGVPFGKGDAYVAAGLAEFTGNQHNEAWAWRRDRLAELDDVMLQRLYDQIKTRRP